MVRVLILLCLLLLPGLAQADEPIPDKDASAGPFYIVWTGAEVGSISSEQWPFQMAKLVSQPSPAARWPALAVDPPLPDPIRAGQALFACNALPAIS